MMKRVEMNNEMMEQVNGGSGIFDFASGSALTVDFAPAYRSVVFASGNTANAVAMDFTGAAVVDSALTSPCVCPEEVEELTTSF